MFITFYHKDDDPSRIEYSSFGSGELHDLRIDPLCVLVDAEDTDALNQTLKAMRAFRPWSLKPLFTTHSGDAVTQALHDGVCQSEDQAMAVAKDIEILAQSVNGLEDAGHQDQRLLRFMFTRPGKRLEPVQDWRHPDIYYYPILESFADPGEIISDWRVRLVRRGLLQEGELRDRLRLCGACSSPHLNYVDVCPNCGDIHIESKKFIHCFTCGHVAPQEAFTGGGILSCPKCQAVLKHIGSDYDRPLDSFLCSACNQRFAEPDVMAHCLQCGDAEKPEELVVQNVAPYVLTEAGRLMARGDDYSGVFNSVENLKFQRPQVFRHMLDTQISITRRYQDSRFGLVGIRIANARELADAIGYLSSVKLVEAFFRLLSEYMRDADISTRDQEYRSWFLMPHADAGDGEGFLARVERLCEQSADADGNRLQIQTCGLFAPGDLEDGENAEQLLARAGGLLQ
ncbi:MAG: hypothetical protein DSZ32_00470 [Gammaproteobacteria bacterium]|nr:MAG: hypothetical protein DSZ32_00470 [Gammaproteobacteria bacterium]